MQLMEDDEWRAFLFVRPHTEKIATVRADGRPYIAPVWFDLDGDDLIFLTGSTSVEGRDLRSDPRIRMCVDDEQAPYSFVLIEGTARLTDNPRKWSVTRRIAQVSSGLE
jgi:PPOX class probable F420-dependent enzyme